MPSPPTPRTLVALDLSPTDDYILAFLAENAQALTDEPLRFIHVEEKKTAPDSSRSLSGAQAALLTKRNAQLNQSMPEALAPKEIKVVSGKPETEIRSWSTAQEIDLLVVGKKPTDSPDVEVKRLVRKPGSSLLLVPEKDDYPIQTIGVAIDFSPLAKMAATEAHRLARRLGAKLLGFHAYQVPTGYHKTGKTRLESAAVMEENARKEAARFFEELEMEAVDMHYAYDKNNQPAEAIAHFAQDHALDLLVIGSKGRTNAASVVMGSVAKKLTKLLAQVPILILKQKNENMDLLDALKKL